MQNIEEETVRELDFERMKALWKRRAAPDDQPVDPPKEEPIQQLIEQPKKQTGIAYIVALCLAVSICTSLATIFAYDRMYAQKVVAVDIKGYIAQQRDSYLNGKINDDELKKSFDRLEAVITSIPKNRVVIMGDAVVRNAETVRP